MKVTIEHEGVTCSVEAEDYVSLDNLIVLMQQAAIGVGFSATLVMEELGHA